MENIRDRQKSSIALPIDVNKISLQVLAKKETLIDLQEKYQNALNFIKKSIRYDREEELIPQSVAIERFRPFISEGKRSEYQETWEEYHQSHKRDGVSSVYFLDYAMGEEKERFKLFNDNINKILRFTEKT